MDARSIKVMPVTSSEVVRILGSLNMKELENVLDEIKLSRRIVFMEEGDFQSHVVDGLARTVVSDGIRKEASVRLYHDFDYETSTFRREVRMSESYGKLDPRSYTKKKALSILNQKEGKNQ